MSALAAFDLDRFVSAQGTCMEDVRAELADGRKASHWIWFIFPQMRGLGFSSMADHYGIGSRAEAEAYLSHPVLGPRLIECTGLVNHVHGRSANQIFGTVDALKFRSSMTLFAAVAPEALAFREALDRYYGGNPDARTLDLLNRAP